MITSDHTFHSYRLPDMDDERAFTADFPPGCASGWDKERYIGYRNYVVAFCQSGDGATQATDIYDDTGELYHRFDGVGGGGHHDFSPDSQWAYFTLCRPCRAASGVSRSLPMGSGNVFRCNPPVPCRLFPAC